jgi:predicted regulator of Ras-like GTPase activity (Roadblock/LC7/MglB family)
VAYAHTQKIVRTNYLYMRMNFIYLSFIALTTITLKEEMNTMAKKSKVEELTDLLKDLEATTPDIEASAVVSVDGLMIASALPQDVEDDRVAAMSAAMLSLGERTAKELARGELSEVYVKGESGCIVLMASGENAVLTALARKDAKLGLVFLDMKRTAEEVARIV